MNANSTCAGCGDRARASIVREKGQLDQRANGMN